MPPDADWPAELARLVPDLGRRLGRAPRAPPDASPELGRARLFEAVVEAVAWAARERPLLLVMEDLQTADAASIELTGYVSRRAGEQALLTVLTHRDLPRSPRVDALEHSLRARGVLGTEVALQPLGPPACLTA